MSPSAGEFDDDDHWNYAPKKIDDNVASQSPAPSGQTPWKRSRESYTAQQNRTADATRAPWKRSKGHELFVDEAAILDNKLALTPTRLSDPHLPSSGMKYGRAAALAGVAVIAAAAWTAGYKSGPGPSSAPPSEAAPIPSPMPGPSVLPSQPAPISSPMLGPSIPPSQPAPISSPIEQGALVSAGLTRERALKLKQMGDDQLTQGLIAPARLLYERAADLGLPQAALALAATYDEAALAHSHLRGIGPDPTAAARWYERAKLLTMGDPDRQDHNVRQN
jgi:hypothetical protein